MVLITMIMMLEDVSFADGEILEINIKQGKVNILFRQWTCKLLDITFDYVWKLVDHNCTGHDIEELKEIIESELLRQVVEDLKAEEAIDEIEALKHYSFFSASNGEAVLEIICETILIKPYKADL